MGRRQPAPGFLMRPRRSRTVAALRSESRPGKSRKRGNHLLDSSTYYHPPELLIQQLEDAADQRAIVMLSPAGYGKTSAARFLAERLSPAKILWYGARASGEGTAWKAFCRAIDLADEEAARRLGLLNPREASEWQQAVLVAQTLKAPEDQET